MKLWHFIFLYLFSQSLFANSYQIASCITDKQIMARSTFAHQMPGDILENTYKFQRINEQLIHIIPAVYDFPDFPDGMELLAEYEGDRNGLPTFKDLEFGNVVMVQCEKNRIIILGQPVQLLDIL